MSHLTLGFHVEIASGLGAFVVFVFVPSFLSYLFGPISRRIGGLSPLVS